MVAKTSKLKGVKVMEVKMSKMLAKISKTVATKIS